MTLTLNLLFGSHFADLIINSDHSQLTGTLCGGAARTLA
jgi:hypothetical protein